jgi:glutamyl-tRNA synthetase
MNVNGQYIRDAGDERLARLIAPALEADEEQQRLLVQAMPELKARAHDLHQLADGARFLFEQRPLALDDGAAALLTTETRPLLQAAHAGLAALPTWEHDALDSAIRAVAEEQQVKLGKLAQPLRAALTGRTTSPGIFDVLALLGQGESLARISDQMVEPNA